jgi:hypothetical protein
MWQETLFGFFCVLVSTNLGSGDISLRKHGSNTSEDPLRALSSSDSSTNSYRNVNSDFGHERRSLLSHPIIPIKKVFWMHIQKTSSWIGDLLLRFTYLTYLFTSKTFLLFRPISCDNSADGDVQILIKITQ